MADMQQQTTSGAGAAPILTATGLAKDFKGFSAVKGIDLAVREGSIHALIGPNGAGKTTVFNLLSKFLTPSRGSIRFRGEDITHLSPATVAQRGLVRSFQISAVFPRFTVLENIRIALQRKHQLSTQVWRSQSSLTVLDDIAMPLLESAGLAPLAHMAAGDLSYGRKRVLELTTTLALDPVVMLLDEPMAGMAHEDIGHVSDLIRNAARGRTVVMVEHNLSVVSNLCDFVSVLQRGEILVEGTYAEVSADARVRSAYMGVDDDE
jgi:branched-chain amino acid transport system ATP-binding protein